VHNGIIENCGNLKAELLSEGVRFASETDTEVVVWLLERAYLALRDPVRAIRFTAGRLKGSYALGIVFSDRTREIYALRKDSPLLVGLSPKGNMLASDVMALTGMEAYFPLCEGEIAAIGPDSVKVYSADGVEVAKEKLVPPPAEEDVGKNGYDCYMRKEIAQTPAALARTLAELCENGLPSGERLGFTADEARALKRLHIVACGTAMHAGLVGRYFIEALARVPVSVDIASEFRYNDPIIGEGDVVVAVSQSGETADTLAAARLSRQKGARVIALVNVERSTLTAEADSVIYTRAGREIAVASTKAYSVQAATLCLLGVYLAYARGEISGDRARELTFELCVELPELSKRAMELEPKCAEIARRFCRVKSLFYIGRGIDCVTAAEASLKLKEISYIHSEAYAAGELKHGTISLVEPGVPVFAVCTDEKRFDKTLSNLLEVISRGASAVLFVKEGVDIPAGIGAEAVYLPAGEGVSTAIAAMTALQLVAYHAARELGYDVDKPRNLAKSVTVE
jgi:glucosamine--fructose-6-phosphate aminotransferase (isomerizing)